jgi:hypothetical protein
MIAAFYGLPILHPTLSKPLSKAAQLASSRLGSCFYVWSDQRAAFGPNGHNCMVVGSNPPGPTTQSSAKRGFLLFAEYPRFSAGA